MYRLIRLVLVGCGLVMAVIVGSGLGMMAIDTMTMADAILFVGIACLLAGVLIGFLVAQLVRKES